MCSLHLCVKDLHVLHLRFLGIGLFSTTAQQPAEPHGYRVRAQGKGGQIHSLDPQNALAPCPENRLAKKIIEKHEKWVGCTKALETCELEEGLGTK